MLDVNFEFVKGILFVRLEGKLNFDNSKNIEKNITNIISNGGIKYLVINVSNLIIEERVTLFDNCNNLIKKNKGKLFICGLKSDINKVISSNYEYCNKINSELSALKMISIC